MTEPTQAMFEGRAVALYGRFLTARRETFAAALARAGGRIARDLTRGTDVFVVGLGATNLATTGALDARLAAARARGVAIWGEERLRDRLFRLADAATLPVKTALKGVPLDDAALATLAAFDVVRLDGELCRFEDAKTLQDAAKLIADGFSAFDAAQSLRKARGAPPGRKSVVAVGAGDAALAWEDDQSLTGLDGQRFLPLDLTETTDDLFDDAMAAEEDGDVAEAARLYAICVGADRRDPVAPYNLANLQAEAGALREAVLNYRVAIAREPAFAEAHYNLSAALEAIGAAAEAETALETALRIDPSYADAIFNLAQLKLKRDAYGDAKKLYEAYLAQATPDAWRDKAERALRVIASASR